MIYCVLFINRAATCQTDRLEAGAAIMDRMQGRHYGKSLEIKYLTFPPLLNDSSKFQHKVPNLINHVEKHIIAEDRFIHYGDN